MMFDTFFKEKSRRERLIKQADQKVITIIARRDELNQARTHELTKQVHLWRIMHLDDTSIDEYFAVSRLITNLVKEIGAIEEYVVDVRSARETCRNAKDCDVLEHLLQVQDPWAEKIKAGNENAIPRVILPTTEH